MKVLIACEYSGTVRDAFIAAGHDAISCDIIPTEAPGPHITGDVRGLQLEGYDLLIAHPPCQYLSYAGMGHWNKPGRAELREHAMDLWRYLWEAPIPRVCIENPFGYPMRVIGRPDQVIDPTYFGAHDHKRTGLWLRGLPPLIYTGPIVGYVAPTSIDSTGKRRYFTDAMPNSKDRAKLRAKTFPEIARAMASQWG